MNEYLAQYEDALFKAAIFEAAKDKSIILVEEASRIEEKATDELALKKFKKYIGRKFRKLNSKSFIKTALKVTKRVAIFIMILITVLFSSNITAEALRERFTQLFVSFDEKYSEVKLDHTDSEGNVIKGDISAQLTGRYVLNYIPDGFKITSITLNSILQDTVYEKGENFISLSVHTENGQTQIDTEDADSIDTIRINGIECLYVEKNGIFTLVWNNDDEYFVLMTNLTREETVKIAESIEKIE